jgi:hypothetical protein
LIGDDPTEDLSQDNDMMGDEKQDMLIENSKRMIVIIE